MERSGEEEDLQRAVEDHDEEEDLDMDNFMTLDEVGEAEDVENQEQQIAENEDAAAGDEQNRPNKEDTKTNEAEATTTKILKTEEEDTKFDPGFPVGMQTWNFELVCRLQ